MSRKPAKSYDHVFGQDKPNSGERKTLLVVVVTLVTMVVEIGAGLVFGSMALLADGLHMGSHAVALGIAVIAYRYARKHATDPRFSFGTGKINALAGYSGAILLGVFSLWMAVESLHRLYSPVDIEFDQALVVAVLGLVVNGASVFILSSGKGGHDHHGHDHHDHGHDHHDHAEDHNFRSAYFHVLADALTSLLAIAALLAAKFYALNWLDPVMGIVGAVLVARWAYTLIGATAWVLLDRQAPAAELDAVKNAVESEPDTQVIDLHVWSIGPGYKAAVLTVETETGHDAEHFLSLLPEDSGIMHTTLEVVHTKRERTDE